MDELRALGFRTVPVTVIDGKGIAGFRPNELSKALELGKVIALRDPSETLPLLERIVTSVQRAIRQMPDDKLDYKAPDRDRPMREFGYHIFRMMQRTMKAIETGVFPSEDQATMDLPGRSFKSFHEIADFGETVIKEYRGWMSKQDIEALKESPGEGLRSGAEQLDLIAGHTTQHLRQLYFVLESFGITPEERMQDSDFPPEYVLTILW